MSKTPHTLTVVAFQMIAFAAAAGATTYPVTLPDALGGSVTIARRPMRIVSLAPNVTEMLFAIGAGDRVVGVTRFCNYPPEAMRLPKVGGYTDISVEAVVALSPDLVVVSRGNPRATLTALSHRGLMLLVAINNESVEEIEAALARIAKATDNEQQAAQVCQNMEGILASVREAVGGVERRRRVYFGSLTAPYFAAGTSSFIGRCIELAGGENLASGVRGAWPILSLERIVARDPEVLIEGFHATAGSGDHRAELLERLRASSVWSRVAAVREERVYTMNDDTIHRPGPRLAGAVAEMARLLYPERFTPDGAKKPE